MSRHQYGQSPSDWTFTVGPADAATLAGGVSITMWDLPTSGTQITDLLDSTGSPITSVTSASGMAGLPIGTIPTFYGPDGVTEMWADAGGGYRSLITAHGAYLSGDAAAATYLPLAGGTMTGDLTTRSVTTDSTVRSAFFKTTSATEHAATVYQAATSGVDVAAALNVVSDNPQTSAMYLSGTETNRGTLKIAHHGQADGSDASAAGLSIDLQTAGTAAQGIFVTGTTGPTTGNLLTLRNNSRDDFVVKAGGAVGIRVATGHTPAGALEIAQADDSTVGLAMTANSGSAQQMVLLKDSGGNSRFEVGASGSTVHRAVAFFTGSLQLGATTSDLGGSSGAVVSIKNATTPPSTNPTGGLIAYADSGTLKYRNPSGAIVVLDGTAVATTDVRPSRQNLLGWSLDPGAAVNSSAVTAGQEVLIRVIAESTGTAGHITLGLGNTPGGCANSYVGIRSASGTLLGSSADASSTLNAASAGKLTLALSAGVSVTQGTVYYVCVLVGSGTTLPTVSRGASNSVINDGLGAGSYRTMTAGSSLTALPSSVTMSGAGQSSTAYYASMSV